MDHGRIQALCRAAAGHTSSFDDASLTHALAATRALLNRFPPPPRLPAILVLGPRTPPRWITLAGTALRVGRAPDNEVVIDDDGVSRRHCRLVLVDDVWRVEDMGSRNGVVWRGARVSGRLLCSGDVLSLGPVCLLYVDEARPESAEAPAE